MANTHTLSEIRSMIAATRKELELLRSSATLPPPAARALALVWTKLEEAELHLVVGICGGVDEVEPKVGR